jgi:hypothetical protein
MPGRRFHFQQEPVRAPEPTFRRVCACWSFPGKGVFVGTVTVPDPARRAAEDQIGLDQIGLLDRAVLPVAGSETDAKLLDPSVPSNRLIQKTRAANAT